MSNKKAVAKGFKAPKQTVDQVVDTTVEELAETPVEVKVKKVRPVTITKDIYIFGSKNSEYVSACVMQYANKLTKEKECATNETI